MSKPPKRGRPFRADKLPETGGRRLYQLSARNILLLRALGELMEQPLCRALDGVLNVYGATILRGMWAQMRPGERMPDLMAALLVLPSHSSQEGRGEAKRPHPGPVPSQASPPQGGEKNAET